jgi:hypothetical protein
MIADAPRGAKCDARETSLDGERELLGGGPRYQRPGAAVGDREDYPLLGYERLLGDWKAEGHGEAVLDRVLRRNAEAFLATLR